MDRANNNNLKCWNIFGQHTWKFRKVKGDLFSAPSEYALAHCVATDMDMGAGIAIQFRQQFGRVTELKRQKAKIGGLAILKVNKRIIYYLVTKHLSSQKPKYNDVLQSIVKMEKHMKKNNIKKLAIPKIGCGLDKLDWKNVYEIIQRVFSKDDVEIVLYEHKPKIY